MSLTTTQLATLCRMLSSCRPHESVADEAFCDEYLAPLGAVKDKHGNWIIDVGDSPRVLWSSHTDTVHQFSGSQNLHVDHEKQIIKLSRKSRKRSACLGADDTVGVFLMREMILAHVPGRYIFHYGEEPGCIGSTDLAYYSPETLAGIQFAIALDRAGTDDVITSQFGDTCCSDEFAASLISALGLTMFPAHGVYTDTAQYMDLVPECTNLSVGYYHQHSSAEYVDYAFVGTLLSALVNMNQASLVCARDPYAPKPIRKLWTPHPIVTRIDGKTSAGLWRHSYGWTEQEWCYTCGAPKLTDDDPDYDDLDHCVCTPEDGDYEELILDMRGLTAEEIKFLRYLKGID